MAVFLQGGQELGDMGGRVEKHGSNKACSRHFERSLEHARSGYSSRGTPRTLVEVANTL